MESEKLVKGWKVVFPPTAPTGAEGKSNESSIRKANMEDVGCDSPGLICIGRSAASNRLLDGNWPIPNSCRVSCARGSCVAPDYTPLADWGIAGACMSGGRMIKCKP